MARLYGFSSWSRLNKFVRRCDEGKIPSDIKLRKEVLERRAELNGLLQEYRSKNGDYKSKLQRRQGLSLKSTKLLDSAFEIHGWPGPDVVGSDCTEALAFVAANATLDADFQNRSTLLMDQALPHGGICAYYQATLRDRYLVLSNKPLIYGTSFDTYHDTDGTLKSVEYEVIDPENLEKRRARAGYDAVVTERLRLAQQAIEDDWKQQTYEQCMAYRENISITNGYQLQ